MGKQIVVYNRIVFSYKRNEIVICSLVVEPQNNYAKWMQPDTIGHIPYNPIYMKYLK